MPTVQILGHASKSVPGERGQAPLDESGRVDRLQEAGHPAHPAYRADIDGLRAVAVLSVVGFHAFPGTVRGGFVGVDVFFVISGFLISTILFGNLARRTFELRDFYGRRVRRIFPALLVVMAATFGFGWFTLMSDEYQALGKHLAAGAGFISNFVFWQESGYFDVVADAKPFLHLWSLGVEEQFYIVWPVVLLATWRWRWNALVVTGVALCASFAVNLRLSSTDQVADFYAPWSRFWELASGSVLAWWMVTNARTAGDRSPRWQDVRSVAGAALLVAALLLVRADAVFPGWWALLPTMGAALLISAGGQAWVNRHVLANNAMVWVGLISYPLYLWHWPILSYIRILDAERPGRVVRIVAIAVAVALAWITYRVVESPMRTQRHKGRSTTVLIVAMTLGGLVGLSSFLGGGFPSRTAANLPIVVAGDLGQQAFSEYGSAHFVPCEPLSLRREAEAWNGAVRCLQSRRGAPDLALVGDSHAEHLFPGLAEALPGRNVVYYLRSSLPVSANPSFDTIFATVIKDPHIRTVVLAAWWGLRLDETPSGTTRDEVLQRTVSSLLEAGKSVYLVDDTPNFSFSARLCKYASGVFRVHRCSDDAAFFAKEARGYAALLPTLQKHFPALHVIHLAPAFCNEFTCSMTADGKLLLRDSDHLSVAGSRYVGKRIVADHPELAAAAP